MEQGLPSQKLQPRDPGRALQATRLQLGLSLRDLAKRTGLPFSTLSKLENGKMTLTYDKLLRIAQGLNVDLATLIGGASDAPHSQAIGRRSVARAGQSLSAESEQHNHLYPAADMRAKLMVPIIITVTARSVEDMGGLVRHQGEEYLYVLSGEMELHTALYEPLSLQEGDSVYFDSGMAHAYVNVGETHCRVLSVSAGVGIQRLAQSVVQSRQNGGRTDNHSRVPADGSAN